MLRLEKRKKTTESSINLSDQASIQQSQKSEDHEVEMKKSREEYDSSRLEFNLVEVEDPVKKWKSNSNQLDHINLIDNIEPAGGASLFKRNRTWTWYWPCLKYCRSVWIRIGFEMIRISVHKYHSTLFQSHSVMHIWLSFIVEITMKLVCATKKLTYLY